MARRVVCSTEIFAELASNQNHEVHAAESLALTEGANGVAGAATKAAPEMARESL